MSGLVLVAPLPGWSAPLDEVPDAVFSARMMGDGVAIDPTGGILHAPCDGTIVTVAAQKHALTLRAANGAEILLHIGIDTVALAGEGFELHVVAGQSVKSGMPLLTFDLDVLARRAKSLMTPIIVTDGEQFTMVRRAQGHSVEVGDFLFELQMRTAAALISTSSECEAHKQVIVSLEHGIHARPAAVLVNRIKKFSGTIALEAHGRTANARSPVALMSLGVHKGDAVTIRARGRDAAVVVAILEEELVRHPGESRGPVKKGLLTGSRPAPGTLDPGLRRDDGIRGVIACRGLAAGRAVQLTRPQVEVVEAGRGVAAEEVAFEQALTKVRTRMQGLAGGHGMQSEIVSAHLAFLEDPELLAATRTWIAGGKSAGYGWRAAVRGHIETLRGLGDARMAERADDLLDLESQVLLALAGDSAAAPTVMLPERAIVLAKELLPSQLIALDMRHLVGLGIATGGPTSHVAILAAAMDIPTLVAMGPAILDIPPDAPLVIDADEGVLHVDPDPAQQEAAEKSMSARRKRRSVERASAQRECRTADGVRIEMLANVGSVAEAKIAVAQGAEGCGLLRTEFLFLDRQSAPTIEEQARHYQQIADAFAQQTLVIRTLDIGGDKPVPYLQLPAEENPALGLRGIRVSLEHPELLLEQLRAVLQIKGPAHCRLLLPMITDASEIRAVRSLLETLRKESAREGAIPVGAMIETPAAALSAAQLAREADFLSIGTNDLAQYTLAIDRGHPRLASRLAALNPAVLRLIAATVEAARTEGKPVAVCGGLASDSAAVPILIGLGVHELSALPSAIPHLKSLISTLTTEQCRALAAQALER